MEKILATENNEKVDDASSTDLGGRDIVSQETVYIEIPESGKRYAVVTAAPPDAQSAITTEAKKRKQKPIRSHDRVPWTLPPHHGKPELCAAEEVRHRFLDRLASGNDAKKNLLYSKVLEKIDEIRGCYADDYVDKNDDRELALKMVLDACFIIGLIDHLAGERDTFLDWHQCLGVATLQFAFADIMVLENQIPYQIIKLILSLLKEKEEGQELLNQFLCWLVVGDLKPGNHYITLAPILRSFDEEHPLHLLEACHRMLAVAGARKPTMSGFNFTKQHGYLMDHTSFSVMDLKAKGVEFSPSCSCSIRDIRFKSGTFRAELQLPVRLVFSNVLIGLSNLIAYEMSPGADSEFEVLSYTNFMRLLIEKPEDVKELQEKGILVNMFQNNEQLVEELKRVDTFGLDNFDIFKDVKLEIEKHCRSKAGTWLADLIHTRFASPVDYHCLACSYFSSLPYFSADLFHH